MAAWWQKAGDINLESANISVGNWDIGFGNNRKPTVSAPYETAKKAPFDFSVKGVPLTEYLSNPVILGVIALLAYLLFLRK